MTTTLVSARTRLRTGLEDSTGSPLWADGTLDEGMKRALDEYSQWSPAQATATFTAVAGDTSATVPTGALQIRRIIDPNGWVIPEQGAEPGRYVGDLELGWLVFAGEIRFSRALIAGDYTVWYFTAHTFPGSDATTFTIPDSRHSVADCRRDGLRDRGSRPAGVEAGATAGALLAGDAGRPGCVLCCLARATSGASVPAR